MTFLPRFHLVISTSKGDHIPQWESHDFLYQFFDKKNELESYDWVLFHLFFFFFFLPYHMKALLDLLR